MSMWCGREVYLDVVELAKELGEPAISRTLKPLSTAKRIPALREILSDAVEEKEDDWACHCVELLSRSIEDRELLERYIEKHGDIKCWGENIPGFEEAKIRVIEICVRTLIEIFPKLGVSEERDAKDKYVDKLVMQKTKVAMLQKILKGWRKAEDETLSDQCFQVILDYLTAIKHHKEKDDLEKTFRLASREEIPARRIARAYLRIVNVVTAPGDSIHVTNHKTATIANHLRVAAAHCFKPALFAWVFSAVQPLLELKEKQYGTVGAAFGLLRSWAKGISELDMAVNELLDQLEKKPTFFYSFRFASIIYPDGQCVELLIQESCTYPHREVKEREWKQWLNLATPICMNWQRKHGYLVKIKIQVLNQYGKHEPLVELERGF